MRSNGSQKGLRGSPKGPYGLLMGQLLDEGEDDGYDEYDEYEDGHEAILVECLRADECGADEYSWIPPGKISEAVKERRTRAGMMGVMNKFTL